MLQEIGRRFAAIIALVGVLAGVVAPLATAPTFGGAALAVASIAITTPADAEAVLPAGKAGSIACQVGDTVALTHYTWVQGGACEVRLTYEVAEDLGKALATSGQTWVSGWVGVKCPRPNEDPTVGASSKCSSWHEGPNGLRAEIRFTAELRRGAWHVLLDPYGSADKRPLTAVRGCRGYAARQLEGEC